MKFTVEIPDDVIGWAHAEGVNRQMIAKFIREELKMVGTRHGGIPELRDVGPGRSHDWRAWLLNDIKVRAQKEREPSLDAVINNR
jgi:hypothetical protein